MDQVATSLSPPQQTFQEQSELLGPREDGQESPRAWDEVRVFQPVRLDTTNQRRSTET